MPESLFSLALYSFSIFVARADLFMKFNYAGIASAFLGDVVECDIVTHVLEQNKDPATNTSCKC